MDRSYRLARSAGILLLEIVKRKTAASPEVEVIVEVFRETSIVPGNEQSGRTSLKLSENLPVVKVKDALSTFAVD